MKPKYYKVQLLSVVCLAAISCASVATDSNKTVVVEEVQVQSTSNKEKASELWHQTKEKTTDAAKSAAEYSKVQGSRALEAGKQGVQKGSKAVVSGSKEAWGATKEVSGKVADYTVDKAGKVKQAVGEVIAPKGSKAPVSEVKVESTN